MILYRDAVGGIDAGQLEGGFFVGWPNPPTSETHLKILQNSAHIVLAVEEESGQVVGFINAISDGVLSAYISLLEVLPDYQGQGVGRELVRRMLAKLDRYYMVDLLCDPPLQAFYARCGMQPAAGMLRRNYSRQAGQ